MPLMHSTASLRTVRVLPSQDGYRADRALAALAPDLSRRDAKALFKAGAVRLNGKAVAGSQQVKAGDTLSIPDSATGPNAPASASAPRLATSHGKQIGRLYEDEHVVVLNKPAEIPVHRNPDGNNKRETLEDVLEKQFRFSNADFRLRNIGQDAAAGNAAEDAVPSENRKSKIENAFFFCHRLDMETTGCLLVAKHARARDAIIRDFENRRVRKAYLAVAAGTPPWERLTVKRPILYARGDEVRASGARPARAVKLGIALEDGDPRGKSCETKFEVLRRYKGFTLLRCEPKTGRMHQIRVHLAAEGFPLAYDKLYGRRSPLRAREFIPRTEGRPAGEEVVLNRLPLHAWKLSFRHPATEKNVTVEAPLPKDLKEFLRLLKKYRPTANSKAEARNPK